MIYSLLILSSPVTGHCSRTAAEFAHCLVARGHILYRVFFLDTGTLAASAYCVFPQDEDDPLKPWDTLAKNHSVELVVCISSALRQGILDATEATRHAREKATIRPSFTIAGLGQLIDAWANSDRLITFGG